VTEDEEWKSGIHGEASMIESLNELTARFAVAP
jgi:hypothetical protein